MCDRQLPSAELLMVTVRAVAEMARLVADRIAAEDGQPDPFSEGAAAALEQLVTSLEDDPDAETTTTPATAPDH